jgi:hypothetical protein
MLSRILSDGDQGRPASAGLAEGFTDAVRSILDEGHVARDVWCDICAAVVAQRKPPALQAVQADLERAKRRRVLREINRPRILWAAPRFNAMKQCNHFLCMSAVPFYLILIIIEH